MVTASRTPKAGEAELASFLQSVRDMGPLPKTLLALILLLPGGFVAAPLLWLAQRWQQRRRGRLIAEQRAAA
jgi:hypothetical protein